MVKLLNRHFGLQALAVQEHRGIVDKFVGDSIVAFWGPPFVKAEEHAMLACRAAQAQLPRSIISRRELPDITGLRRDTPTVDLCIGICTGEVVVGNIGSENTRSYTVVGDTVNVAARLERANRVYGTQILINESTAQAIGSQFETREIDTISVKGKTETTRIFELMSAAGATIRRISPIARSLRRGPAKLSRSRLGYVQRRLFANVCKFVRMTARPVFSLSEFSSCAEILPATIGMAFGI